MEETFGLPKHVIYICLPQLSTTFYGHFELEETFQNYSDLVCRLILFRMREWRKNFGGLVWKWEQKFILVNDKVRVLFSGLITPTTLNNHRALRFKGFEDGVF